jgi:phthalate 4,5-dioxygenase oxygenase subunit
MLSKEENELLTQTGPGTPMGQLLRHYWAPVLLAEEVPDAGSPPVRVKLMGERLVVFRDHDGNIGALDEFCAHRGASLFFGRNESTDSRDGNCGLRCCYHGWKYRYDGQCVDMPNEPENARFKDDIRLKAYPAREHGSVIWIYMGPIESMPPLPEYEWTLLPDSHRYITKRLHSSNFMQPVEGSLDSSHVSFLHSDAPMWHPNWTHQMYGTRKHVLQPPQFRVRPTDFGFVVGARRETDDAEHDYWRITNWVMPWNVSIPRDDLEPMGAHSFVPIDDEHCWAWNISYVPERPLTQREIAFYSSGGHIHAEQDPKTFVPVRTLENDYLINRDLQRTVSYTGITGIVMQDAAMQESMGAVSDRSRENLGSADSAILALRRRLMGEARALRDEGKLPTGRNPESHHLRSISAVLPGGVDWLKATEDLRRVEVPVQSS